MSFFVQARTLRFAIQTSMKKVNIQKAMTLGNMRANGVRSLAVYCSACHHQAVIDVSRYADDVALPTFGPRMLCTMCGAVGADARPNWQERAPVGAFIGHVG